MYPLIAIIDQDNKTRENISQFLQHHNYSTVGAFSVRQGLQAIQKCNPCLIITDLTLSDSNGLRVVRQIRSQTQLPILILSNLADEATKVGAFKLGADDYVIKPASLAELLARVEALLRRYQSPPLRINSVIRLGKLEIDLEKQEAWRNGIHQHFSQTEWRLLKILIKYIDQIVDHQTLLTSAWGPNYHNETQYLHVYMRKLRRKLEFDPSHPRLLMTEWGVGYRLVRLEIPKSA